MHIALICDELPPGPHGGVGSITADLAEGLAGAGHRVTILVAESARYWSLKAAEPLAANPRVAAMYLSSPDWMRWRPGAFLKRWSLLRRLKAEHARTPFDLVECMDNCGLLPFGGIRGTPTVVRLHGASLLIDFKLGLNTTDPLTHWFEKRTLKQADRLIGVSDFIGREEPLLAGLEKGADHTIYNSVDMDLFSPGPEGETEEGLIVFANSIHPLKGVFELCRAMNIIGREYPGARLVILERTSPSEPPAGPCPRRLPACWTPPCGRGCSSREGGPGRKWPRTSGARTFAVIPRRSRASALPLSRRWLRGNRLFLREAVPARR